MANNLARLRLMSFGMILITSLGCGWNSSEGMSGGIEGVVTLGKSPLQAGTIQFYSKETGEGAITIIEPGGKYLVASIPIGKYWVEVRPLAQDPEEVSKGIVPPKPSQIIPEKYTNFATSGLEVTVSSGKNEFNVSLQ